MLKQTINKSSSAGTVFSYGFGKDSNSERSMIAITEKPVENRFKNFELWAILFGIIIRLIAMVMKLIIQNRQPVE